MGSMNGHKKQKQQQQKKTDWPLRVKVTVAPEDLFVFV